MSDESPQYPWQKSWDLVIPQRVANRFVEIFGSLEAASAWYGHRLTVAEPVDLKQLSDTPIPGDPLKDE